MAASPRVPRTSGDDQPGGGQDVVGSNRGNATFGSKRTVPVVCQGMNGSHRGTTTAAVHSVVGAAGTGRRKAWIGRRHRQESAQRPAGTGLRSLSTAFIDAVPGCCMSVPVGPVGGVEYRSDPI